MGCFLTVSFGLPDSTFGENSSVLYFMFRARRSSYRAGMRLALHGLAEESCGLSHCGRGAVLGVAAGERNVCQCRQRR